MVLSSFACGSGGPPLLATWSPAICVHTAVIKRKLMQQESRSMNGTRLSSASSAFFPPFPVCSCGAAEAMSISLPAPDASALLLGEVGRDPHLVLVGDDQVQHSDRRLVDVVDHVLRTALQERERHQGRDRHDQAEGGAVHRFRDAVGQDPGLLGRVYAG